MTAPTDGPTICVAYPTIMSGLVLRWYADAAAFREGVELANAGRECFQTFDGCPDDVRNAADSAHSYLAVEYRAHVHTRPDVSRWVTHTTRIFSDDLTPVAAKTEDTPHG